jgi:hypothetical protein
VQLLPGDAYSSQEMELDLAERIHEESSIFFPEVIALERRLAGR